MKIAALHGLVLSLSLLAATSAGAADLAAKQVWCKPVKLADPIVLCKPKLGSQIVEQCVCPHKFVFFHHHKRIPASPS